LSKYYNYNPDPEYEYSPKHSSSKRNSAEALANYQVQQFINLGTPKEK